MNQIAEGEVLETDAAIAQLAVRETDGRRVVHTFISVGMALLGADMDVDAIRAEAAEWGGICVAGSGARGMRHGLVIRRPTDKGDSLFLETKE
jgi:hypothetical protein